MDSVSWLPAPGEDSALRDRAPTVGEAVALRVRHPFDAIRGRPLVAIFQPVLAALNGWLDHPELLPRSAIVSLRIDGWRRSDDSALVDATVESIRLFSSLPDVPDARTVEGPIEIPTHPAGAGDRVEIAGLQYIEGSVQSDLGGWALLRGDTLWLHGRWGAHEDHALVGPARITAVQRATLDAVSGAKGP